MFHDIQVRGILSGLHEVHIRWAREDPYVVVAPFGSRVSAGVGVGVSPLKRNEEGGGEGVCRLLRRMFGTKGIECRNYTVCCCFFSFSVLLVGCV